MARDKNLIVKILVGIPASGKTTWSEQWLMNHDNWVRVNRDDFRKMLRNEAVCEFQLENMITELCYEAVLSALEYKRNVIVDNTHLQPEHIDRLIECVETYADVEFQIFDMSLEKAIERDANRAKKVGEKVITRMYKDYKKLVDSYQFINRKKVARKYVEAPFDENLPSCVLFDIDGTLAHMNGKRGPFDWLKVDVDDLDVSVARTFKLHKQVGDTVFCVSGRDESARQKTEEWLDFYDLHPNGLFMRPRNDYRPDTLIKKEIYMKEFKDKYNILNIYDDRNQVVDMWRNELGLKCYQVNYGRF